MLRFLYRSILRLHPSVFRKRFGDEMLSIFEQATGGLAAIQLLADGFMSVARQWLLRSDFRHQIPAPQLAIDGIPSFSTIDPFRPRPAAVFPSLVLSMAVFCLTCVAIKYSWIRVLNIRVPEVQFEAPQWIPPSPTPNDFHGASPEPSPESHVSATPAPTAQTLSRPLTNALTQPTTPAKTATNPSPRPAGRIASQPRESALALVAAQQQATAVHAPSKREVASAASEPPRDAAALHRVINRAISNLNQYYVDPAAAQKMSSALRAHENNGDDNGIAYGAALAQLLTTQMRSVSHDNSIQMEYKAADTPQNPAVPSPAEIARYRKEILGENCTFEKIEILPHNIGYLKLNAFPDASICGPTAKAAMAKLNHADAIIFDLRDNSGGYANMVALLATYLFDRPTHLNDFYDRAANSTEHSWTLPPVRGNKLADKPAFVLTSHTTFSAAEGFSYDLKILKRATLVGETTSGRGHMGAQHRIDDYFTMRIPSVKVTNPVSGTNWEGTGVQPDVKVNAADALKTAIHLAETRMQK